MQGPAEFNNIIATSITIVGPNGQLLVYDTATPQSNHLIASDAPAAFLDSAGNYVLAGRTSYRQVSPGIFMACNLNPANIFGGSGAMVNFFSASTEQGPGNPWTLQGTVNADQAGSVWIQSRDTTGFFVENAGQYNFTGNSQALVNIVNGTAQMTLKSTALGVGQVTNSNDLQDYFLGHAIKRLGANTLVNSTTPTTLITFPNVAVGYYRLRSRIPFTSGTGTIQPFSPRIAGNCVIDIFGLETALMQVPVSGANLVTGEITAQNTDPTGNANLANSTGFRWEIEGFIHVSTAGSLLLTGRCGLSSADEPFTAGANTWMEIAAES